MDLSRKYVFKPVILAVAILLTAGCVLHKPEQAQREIPDVISNISPVPKTLSGSYLAGRFAQQYQDWDKAFEYMSQALALAPELQDESLIDRTFLLAVGNGNIDDASELADRVMQSGDNAELAVIVKTIVDFEHKNHDTALKRLTGYDTKDGGGFTLPLLQAWIQADRGEFEIALDILDQAAYENDPVYILNTALIYDLSGNVEKAEATYQKGFEAGLTLHEVLVAGNFFERQGNPVMTEKIYDAIYAADPKNPFVAEGYKRLKNNITPENVIKNAKDGLVFSLFSMAALLYERQAYDSALIYARIVEYLKPEEGYINLILGDMLAISENFDEALIYYRRIDKKDLLSKMAHMRIVEVLEAAGRTSEALDVLSTLAEDETVRLEALTYIGDIYQRQERYDLALGAYDHALSSLGSSVGKQHWGIIYARGMAYERLDNWGKAERDLLKALEYQPNNPHILNYLGYSWINKGVNIEQGMEMIRKAVMLKPQDGYIIDSYGWAYYKQGKYAESVYWLERAVEMVPNDMTLNDHLGDAYWQVNREKEARFQWERAAKFTKTTEQKNRLAEKIKSGIKRVPAPTDPNREAALHSLQ